MKKFECYLVWGIGTVFICNLVIWVVEEKLFWSSSCLLMPILYLLSLSVIFLRNVCFLNGVIDLFLTFYLVFSHDIWWLMYLQLRFLKWKCNVMDHFFLFVNLKLLWWKSITATATAFANVSVQRTFIFNIGSKRTKIALIFQQHVGLGEFEPLTFWLRIHA